MILKFINLKVYIQQIILLSREELSAVIDLYLLITWAFAIFKRKLSQQLKNIFRPSNKVKAYGQKNVYCRSSIRVCYLTQKEFSVPDEVTGPRFQIFKNC